MADFAALLTQKRRELGLSQGELAKRLNVTRQAVSKWENGKGIPDISILTAISEVLGVSMDELLTGKEPEPRVVEKIVIQEKEVTKPIPARKILAIVAPIVLVVVLASALLGVYIPKAIAANTPPIVDNTEPEPPEIVYTNVKIKGKSNTDDSTFQAPLIENKAYYSLVMQCSSDYTLYITAPKGAVATLNGEVIAEFDTAKTVEYKRYFKTVYFKKNDKFDASSLNTYEYVQDGVLVLDGNAGACLNYVLIVDMTNCDEEDRNSDNHKLTIRQHYGFDDVTVPANGTYFVAFSALDEENAWHYVIKNEGIKYVQTFILHRAHNYSLDSWATIPKKTLKEFYMYDYKGNGFYGKDCDWQIVFINETDKDIKLEIEEIPIEEIELGQEITVESVDNEGIEIIYKLELDKDTVLMFDMLKTWSGGGVVTPPNEIYTFGNSDRRNGSNWDIYFCGSYRENRIGYKYHYPISPGWVYVVIRPQKGRAVIVVVEDWDKYYSEHYGELVVGED
ncbi:MAG: helix-turn-helix domain-containing protein [Clostridia bacterium]|nr:helix-turn-helix domain-containing protein [Clostridia bacterium]